MSLDDKVVDTVLSMSRQMGEIAASIAYMEEKGDKQEEDLAALREQYHKLRHDREIERARRRTMPDELLEFVRKEHARAVAREKFWTDLRDGLLKKGLLGVAGVLGGMLILWAKSVWPQIQVKLIEWLSR